MSFELNEMEVYGNVRYAEGVFHCSKTNISAHNFLTALRNYETAIPEEERRKLHDFRENSSLAKAVIRTHESQHLD
jgi:hypothetical protein